MALRRCARNKDHNPKKCFIDKYFLPLKRLHIVSKQPRPTERGSVYARGLDPWVDTTRIFGTTRCKAERANRHCFPPATYPGEENLLRATSLVPEPTLRTSRRLPAQELSQQQRRSTARERTPRRPSAARESTLQQPRCAAQESTSLHRRFTVESTSQLQFAARESTPQQRRSAAPEFTLQQQQQQQQRYAARESTPQQQRSSARECTPQQRRSATRERTPQQRRSTARECTPQQRRSTARECTPQPRRSTARECTPQPRRSSARECTSQPRRSAALECTSQPRRSAALECTPQRRRSVIPACYNAPMRTPSPRAGHPFRDDSPLSERRIRSMTPAASHLRTPCTARSRDICRPRAPAEQFHTPMAAASQSRQLGSPFIASPHAGRALMSASSASRRLRRPPPREDDELPKTPPRKRGKLEPLSNPPDAPRHKVVRDKLGIELDLPEILISFFEAVEWHLLRNTRCFYRDIRPAVTKLARTKLARMDVDFSISYLAHLLHVAHDCIRSDWVKYPGSGGLEITLRVKELHNKPLDRGTQRERRAHVEEILKTYDGNATLPEKPDLRKSTKKVCDLDLATSNPVVGPASPLPRVRETTRHALTPYSNGKRRLSSVKENAKKVQEQEANKRRLEELQNLHFEIEDRKTLVPLIDSLLGSPNAKKCNRNRPINFDSLVIQLWRAQYRRLPEGVIRKALEKIIGEYPSWISLFGGTDRLIRYPRIVQVNEVLAGLDAEKARLSPLSGVGGGEL